MNMKSRAGIHACVPSAALMATVTILVFMDSIGTFVKADLSCKACVIYDQIDDNPQDPVPCAVVPCNSLEDVTSAYKKMNIPEADKTGVEIDPSWAKSTQFACSRAVGYFGGPQPPFITNMCVPRHPAFPPSDKAYNVTNYNSVGGNEVSFKDSEIDHIKVSFMRGIVYICDESVGNGPNCGAKSSDKISDEERKSFTV